MKDHNLDKLFREAIPRLEGIPETLERKPNPNWRGLEQRLHPGRRKKILLWSYAAALIVLMASAGILMKIMYKEPLQTHRNWMSEAQIKGQNGPLTVQTDSIEWDALIDPDSTQTIVSNFQNMDLAVVNPRPITPTFGIVNQQQKSYAVVNINDQSGFFSGTNHDISGNWNGTGWAANSNVNADRSRTTHYSTNSEPGKTYSWTVIGAATNAGKGTQNVAVDWGSAGIGTFELTNTDMTGEFRCDAYAVGDATIYRSQHVYENPFKQTAVDPLSTFSIDVDPASYSHCRGHINDGLMPRPDMVRIEEFVNYFDYAYPEPRGEDVFAVDLEVAACPWKDENRLLRIGIKGKEIPRSQLPASNFVLLVDVSGSMQDSDKLPMLQEALTRFVDESLRQNDKIAIVVYAGNAGLVLPSTSGNDKETIKAALDMLQAGGSTAGGEGIQLAYKVARRNFIKGGNNRVILATDGDFNVGISNDQELEKLIEMKREQGVFLSVLGVGTGNYRDQMMQTLADKGNGNHSYLDNLREANKVLGKEFGSNLFTIAKDVKLQLEFNPNLVGSYRLIGYENRMLQHEDFENDKIDAGELGPGHTVTALYEITPVSSGSFDKVVSGVKALFDGMDTGMNGCEDLLSLSMRYKKPDGDRSTLMTWSLQDVQRPFSVASEDFRFAASVAAFGMVLRNSQHKGDATMPVIYKWAEKATGLDKEGYRAEFLDLIDQAHYINVRDEGIPR